jgi:hypothetical protein
MGNRTSNFLSTKQAKWRTTAQQLKSLTKKKDEAVPMEINAGQIRDKDPVTSSWNGASLYASWTRVSSGTGQYEFV